MKNFDKIDIFGIPLTDCIPHLIKLGALIGLIAAVIVIRNM